MDIDTAIQTLSDKEYRMYIRKRKLETRLFYKGVLTEDEQRELNTLKMIEECDEIIEKLN